MRCPKCKGEEKTKIRYYLERIGFRRIERLLGVSHTAVIYWVKKAGEKINDSAFEGIKAEKKAKKVDVLEPERTNRLLRHYLAHFARKTYSISKSFDMILYFLYLFSFRHILTAILF